MSTQYNISIAQGETFRATLELVDSGNNLIDTTNFTISGEARTVSENMVNVIQDLQPIIFRCTKLQPYSSGKVQIELRPVDTETIQQGDSYYDIWLNGTNEAFRVLYGTLTIISRYTRTGFPNSN